MKQKYPLYRYSEEDAKNGIARFVRLDNPQSYPFDDFHAHEYNEILVFIKGGGIHNINFRQHSIQDNSIHLLAANDLHWAERNMTSHGFAIVYKEQFLYKLEEFTRRGELSKIFSASKIINLTNEETDSFRFIFQELINNSNNKLYTLSLIGAFLIKIANTFENTLDIPQNTDPIIKDVLELINKHYKEHKSLQFYADELSIPLRTLVNRVKNASGNNLKEIIQEKTLKEAKRKIIQAGNNLHIGTVAHELGFNETAHFTNWFKRKTGISPTKYKAEM